MGQTLPKENTKRRGDLWDSIDEADPKHQRHSGERKDIEKFMPQIFFESMDKIEIIKKFVFKEFNRFIEYYQRGRCQPKG